MGLTDLAHRERQPQRHLDRLAGHEVTECHERATGGLGRGEGAQALDPHAIGQGEAELDIAGFRSNTFELEHPKGSGVMCSYPEVDRVEWFDIATAQRKINSGQVGLLLELQRLLGDS